MKFRPFLLGFLGVFTCPDDKYFGSTALVLYRDFRVGFTLLFFRTTQSSGYQSHAKFVSEAHCLVRNISAVKTTAPECQIYQKEKLNFASFYRFFGLYLSLVLSKYRQQ